MIISPLRGLGMPSFSHFYNHTNPSGFINSALGLNDKALLNTETGNFPLSFYSMRPSFMRMMQSLWAAKLSS